MRILSPERKNSTTTRIGGSGSDFWSVADVRGPFWVIQHDEPHRYTKWLYSLLTSRADKVFHTFALNGTSEIKPERAQELDLVIAFDYLTAEINECPIQLQV